MLTSPSYTPSISLRTSDIFQTGLLLISGMQDSLSSPVWTGSPHIRYNTHTNTIAYEKGAKRLQLTTSHSCKWSRGNTPFSGGTGLAPLFPPNAPPAGTHKDIQILAYYYHVVTQLLGRKLGTWVRNRSFFAILRCIKLTITDMSLSSPALISQELQDSDPDTGSPNARTLQWHKTQVN
jgi:hypothetical protein